MKIIAKYQTDSEHVIITQYPNGKFYNHYNFMENLGYGMNIAGGFDSFEEAEAALYRHRPAAYRIDNSLTEKSGAELLNIISNGVALLTCEGLTASERLNISAEV